MRIRAAMATTKLHQPKPGKNFQALAIKGLSAFQADQGIAFLAQTLLGYFC